MNDFTRRARKIFQEYAPIEVRRLGHKSLRDEHIMLAMIRAENFQFLKELVVGSIFSKLRVDAKRLAIEIEKLVEVHSFRQADGQTSNSAVPGIIESSRNEARQLNHVCIGTEHVLLALLQDKAGFVTAALAEFGVTYQVVRDELRAMHG